ncbi:unnamed protein product, partial [marine sediment metagenome]
VSIDKNNVKFSGDLVSKALKESEYDIPDYGKESWVIDAGAHQTLYYDIERKRKKGFSEIFLLIFFNESSFPPPCNCFHYIPGPIKPPDKGRDKEK